MQLADLFAASLVGQRDSVGLDVDRPDGLAAYTFGELDARSNRLARALLDRGCRSGDRLCVYLANRVEFVDLVLACVKTGIILVPINILYREREIGHIVSDAEPRAVVTTASQFSLFPPVVELWDVDELDGAASRMPAGPVRLALEGTAPAALVYTSGTTGRSKGAVLSHDNFLANAANLVACWRITAADRYLAVLPLFHVHGLGNGLMTWLASGCRMRLVERFEAGRAAALFGEFRPTLFFGVPTIYTRLLELDAEAARSIGATMRLFVSGSAPLPSTVFEAFRDRFGHAILERYGMSETLMNISNPYAGERRPGSVGFPLPGVAARIVDAEGRDAAEGATGELLVRGPNVFSGYWRQPEATAAAFISACGPSERPEGSAASAAPASESAWGWGPTRNEKWFRTGDLAARSDDGYYTLHGRRSDLIISGGFNIYPREIEEVLTEMPGIREAVVVGVPDARRGELPVAYIVADAPLDTEALEVSCRRALASFKVPRRFVQVEALPRTALGKVQKHLLPPLDTHS